MKRFVSWSGGEDSTASIILCHEKGIHLDGVVMSEVMFDHRRNISGEHPEHIEWVYKTAKPIIEEQFGYKVYILRDESDYIQEFFYTPKNPRIPERANKHAGFLLGGMCVANRNLKMRPLRKFFAEVGECEQIVGICADEAARLQKLSKKVNRRALLAELGIEKHETAQICRKYNLRSPIYKTGKRQGCWFCPNTTIKGFAELKKRHPELWEELRILSLTENLVSQSFRYELPFAEVDRRIDELNSQPQQISIFDFLEDET